MLERYCIVDVETTGFSPVTDRIVELACVLVDGDRVAGRWGTLVNPRMPIPADATAVHGITDRMVAGAPDVAFALHKARSLSDGRTIAAHCAHFDLSFVGPAIGSEALCTMRLARAVFPEAPNHKNQTLRRYLGIDRIAGEHLEAHRARSDALVSAYILIACRRRFRAGHWCGSWARFVRRNALVCRKAT